MYLSLDDNKVMGIAQPKTALRFNDTHYNHAQLINNNNSSISFDYKLGCEEHWYGPLCIKQCIPQYNVFTCSPKGERVCNDGLYGEYCESIKIFIFLY